MPQTPLTTATPYCDPTSAITSYCDWRPLGDLFSDTETRIPQSALIFNAGFLECLMAASAMVEEACLIGGRYTVLDLQLLANASAAGAPSVLASQASLRRIVAKIAEGLAFQRRPEKEFPNPEAYYAITGQGGTLDRLAAGERIFGFQQSADAGRMDLENVTESDLLARNDAVTQARRFYGMRARDWQ